MRDRYCTKCPPSRFPKAKLIVGHFGERIPSDLIRIESRKSSWFFVARVCSPVLRTLLLISSVAELLKQVPFGLPMKQNVSAYWRTNIFETSSGNFATNLLKFHIEEIGLKQIMYSIDYPYVRACFDLFYRRETLTLILRSICKTERHGSTPCPKVY